MRRALAAISRRATTRAGGCHPSRNDSGAAAGFSRAAAVPPTAESKLAPGPIALRPSTSVPRASTTGTDPVPTPGQATPSMQAAPAELARSISRSNTVPACL
jgi:hypothetical protein